ncbi:hypothetical protein RRF57_007282 [Xylaria bambusicola]|uniref:Uncharacterized protein n=1 Tax=Xylaria bambusicola TaxID=326684 RepID=A0AAN7ZAE1_9PEZI
MAARVVERASPMVRGSPIQLNSTGMDVGNENFISYPVRRTTVMRIETFKWYKVSSRDLALSNQPPLPISAAPVLPYNPPIAASPRARPSTGFVSPDS